MSAKKIAVSIASVVLAFAVIIVCEVKNPVVGFLIGWAVADITNEAAQ